MSAAFELGWYNGWSPQERLASVPIQREAIRTGTLARPTHCSICQFSKGDHPDSHNRVWMHNENYSEPLSIYAICRTCHRLLHERFDAPDPWLALVRRHGSREQWFTRLSMEPASQNQPFATTYPHGLPPP